MSHGYFFQKVWFIFTPLYQFYRKLYKKEKLSNFQSVVLEKFLVNSSQRLLIYGISNKVVIIIERYYK